MKANSAEIIFVVDRSGSMTTIVNDMKGGFNSLITEQKKLPGECKVSLTQFDDQYELVYQGKPLAEVPPLELVPRGSTALLDAVGRTIVATGERLSKLAEDQRPSHVLFVIITDGQENSSKEFSLNNIKEMITHQRDVYKWEFSFLGTDFNAIAVSSSMGIPSVNAVQYVASPVGGKSAMRGVSKMVANYRSSTGGNSDLGTARLYNEALLEVDAEEAANKKEKGN